MDSPRPRGARLLEAFSLKLARRICLFDYAAFDLWTTLEADPNVLTLCERPVRLECGSTGRLIDFWVRRRDREELLVLDDGDPPVLARMDGVTTRVVTASDLAAQSLWVANWQRMLPVITATRSLVPVRLTNSILNLVRGPVALSRVEHELALADPSLVRGAVFDLIRTGLVQAPTLRTELLSMHTLLEPAA
ncbi:MAG TPA: hypothetical protein VFP68_07715 [Burkholderiaceae bacterium]|nr:hypothetical protein [Burkholderiaceae bacterium]